MRLLLDDALCGYDRHHLGIERAAPRFLPSSSPMRLMMRAGDAIQKIGRQEARDARARLPGIARAASRFARAAGTLELDAFVAGARMTLTGSAPTGMRAWGAEHRAIPPHAPRARRGTRRGGGITAGSARQSTSSSPIHRRSKS